MDEVHSIDRKEWFIATKTILWHFPSFNKRVWWEEVPFANIEQVCDMQYDTIHYRNDLYLEIYYPVS